MTHIIRITAAVVLASFIPLLAEPAPVRIPFRWTPGQIEIQVSIDGRAPIWCILDSGAEFSMLDARVAETLKIGPVVRHGSRERIENVSLRIGLVTLRRQNLTLWNLDNFRRQKREIRGVIGCELFERYVVTIDYEKRAIILNEPRSFHSSAAARQIPITFSGHLPVVETTLLVRGKRLPAKLMVDTGASQAVILRHPFATRNRVFSSEDTTSTAETVATGGRGFTTVSVEELRLDRWTFRKPSVKAYATPSGAGGDLSTDGLLGNDVLRQFRVTFDYSRRRLILEEP